MHGHFQTPRAAVPEEIPRVDAAGLDEFVNMGIGIVTPIDKVLDLTDQTELPRMMAAAADQLRNHNGPTPALVKVNLATALPQRLVTKARSTSQQSEPPQ